MRRHILLVIVLCMHFSARGQTTYEYRYWFDGDISASETGRSASDAWSMEVDLSHLMESFHTIHLQVTDEEGVSSTPVTRSFFLSREEGALTNGYYWFDDEVQARTVRGDVQGTLTFDVTELQEGFHTLHYQVKRADGLYSQIETRCFYKMQSDQIVGELTFMCYIDGETFKQERVSVENGTAAWFLDVSELPIGFHKLQVRALMQNGSSTTNCEAFFLREAMPSELNSMTCVCSIDGKVFRQEKMQTANGTGLWQIDVSDLPIGFHRLQLRAVMENGASTSIREAFFLRNAMDAELEALSCVFSVDGKPYKTIESGVHEGLFHCDLDVAELSDGLHKISYMLRGGKGAQTTVKSQYFIKQPVGGNSIKMYQYWLNDNDDMAHTVVQQEVTDPLKLITLLPVEQQPFRSKLFHFDVKDGKPMVYAKNEIHLRFYDNSGRWVDASDQYADYQIGQEVKPIKTLESGKRETTGWPEENEIKWYKVTAERGERMTFKLDHAATLQVFSPSGDEVHKVYGSESVTWNGFNAEENGIFYVALHDVTATQGEAICIDYEHIDRYAVLRQDVSVIGNNGYSTITFEGNGYDELTSVELIQGSNIIPAVEIGHESNATTSVKFDFSGATLGEYKAVFHFAEGELTIEKCITVEEPRDIEFATTVTYNSVFMKWDTNKYVFKINNLGNMTAYKVPISIYVYTEKHDYLTYAKVNGFNMHKYYKDILGDKYTDSLTNVVNREMAVSGDKYFFAQAIDDEYIANNPCVHWASINPDLHPGTNELSVEVKMDETHRTVYVYLIVPEDWDNNAQNASSRRRSNDAWDDECLEARLLKLRQCKIAYDYYIYSGREDMTLLRANGCIKKSEYCKNRPRPGGAALSIQPGDPNDILGYIAESGSHALKDSLTDVFYKIEFENDPEIATASAHEIIVIDTLDATKFDLSTYAPTRITIGERTADLTGDKNFVATIDMRPEINAIAQVTGEYNQTKGIAKWHISSLDPMTMEPTDDVMQGVLPINYNGNGIGEVSFNINRKAGLPDGTEIKNRASIIFDKNEAILTPTWTNIVDAVAPSSRIDNSWMANDSTLRVTADASDARSGVWKYEWYVQAGENAPWWKEGETYSNSFDYHIYEGIDYGFCVLVTDSAGNVEQKVIERERGFKTYGPDYEDTIEEVPATTVETEDAYDVSGRKVGRKAKGIIIRHSDGTTRKVLTK